MEEDLPTKREDVLAHHLAAIVDSSDDAIFSRTVEGTILSWNPSAQRLFGYAAEEAVGQPVSILVPEERSDEVAELVTRIARGERVDAFRTVRVRKDGTRIPVSLTISPIKDESQRIIGAWTIAHNLSERNQLETLRNHLAAIVDSSDDAILSKDLNGTILSWNAAAERLYGYSAAEVVGKPISILLPEDRSDEIRDILSRIARGERIEHFETLRVRKDGTRVRVSLTISPVMDGDGYIVGVSTIARDIGKYRRLNEELKAARDDALKASRMKSEFVATMSHEIRTPLNAVIGMSGLLLDTNLDPEQREYAETVRSSGEALLDIVNEILDFSKIEAGMLELEEIDFNLRVAIENAIDVVAERARTKGLELLALIGPDVPVRVAGDATRLRQILLNLISNAIKFTEHGEITVRVSVEEEKDSEALLRFEVADTGRGIEPEQRRRLFDAFTQSDASTTRTHGGTGLGLAISKRLVERMGGQIDVESELGVGSTFWFTVQLTKRPDTTLPSLPPNLVGLRVLIVDDNPTNRKILERQIGSWRMHPATAPEAKTALDMLHEAADAGEPYDVAILDMDMPGMDGVELAERIASDEALAPTRTLLLPSSGRASAAAARRARVSAYLTKPIRSSKLYDCLLLVMGGATAEAPMVTAGALAEAQPGSRSRVLVAEDNAVNQKVAATLLAKMGYRADVVSDGAEAVEALSRIKYGAVLMDCHMPGMDGYEAAAEIRKRERGSRHTPIIAMTAAATKEDRDRALDAGMDDFVAKPVQVEQLASVLTRWTGEHEERAKPKPLEGNEPASRGKAVDEHRLAELQDLGSGSDVDVLGELLDLFVRGTQEILPRLQRAVAEEDASELEEAAHSLKGAAANIGATGMVSLCGELEAIGRSGGHDIEAAPALVRRLVEEFDRVRAAIRIEAYQAP